MPTRTLPMTATASPYVTLGVSDTATQAEIHKAYRRLAFRYHPDRNAGDPAAAEAFLAVKEAFEHLREPAADAGFDVERVVAEMERAAAEAERRRGRPQVAGRAWQQVHVELDRPARGWGRALVSRQSAAGLGVVFVVALGTALGGIAPVWVGAGLGLALGSVLVGREALRDRRGPWAVETHWQGLRDLRWDVLVSWSEIRGVHEGDGALDLALTEAAVQRLARLVPAETFAEPGRYRLPLGDPSSLVAVLRAQLAA